MVHSEFFEGSNARAARWASLVHKFLGLNTEDFQDAKLPRDENLPGLLSEFPTTENSDKESQIEKTLLGYLTKFKLSLFYSTSTALS